MIDVVNGPHPWSEPFQKLPDLLRAINGPTAGGHYFCFQHTHDLSKLSGLFLLWRTISGIEYKINIGDICIEDPDSYDGQAMLAGLEGYANDVLSAARGYRDRLIERNIIHDSSPFSEVDLLTCPVCHSRLQNCGECNVAVCSSNGCAGSQAVNIEKCDNHDSITCHDCLESMKMGPNSTFVRCPSCNSWSCSAEVCWCPGRIIHPPLGPELVELCSKPGFDIDSVMRSHLPMPGPCESCIHSGHVNAWQECTAYESDLCPRACFDYHDIIIGAYCPECIIEDKGQHCVCGDARVCDACLLTDPSSPNYPQLISCPCCEYLYCREGDGCQYCHFCQICLRTGLCFGCQARKKSDAGEGDETGEGLKSLKVYERCERCRVWMCNECCSTARNGVMQCPHCHVWICGKCAGGWCHSCP
ncbi:hypothetical protein L210DRAFT_2562054 [Boletus edulis BED1]|uniref:Uncharacterized protein n=1 Tax=Boletus edulis BED1 TaxID=1328754 RepID=A0AAD4GC30_BOLED|nr:hypothetical protein L210DRAFT_2562054 [Boletus edulis BED1]